MAVIIRGGALGVAGWTQNAGVFIGQNVQHGWDSMSPMKAAVGFNMGDYSLVTGVIAGYASRAADWQSIQDNDVKGNLTTRYAP